METSKLYSQLKAETLAAIYVDLVSERNISPEADKVYRALVSLVGEEDAECYVIAVSDALEG